MGRRRDGRVARAAASAGDSLDLVAQQKGLQMTESSLKPTAFPLSLAQAA